MNKADEQMGSVGVMQTQTLKLDLPPEGFVLNNGQALPELQVAYECYGELSATRDNVVFVCHALTGDAHAAGIRYENDKKPGWWDAMIGPGKGIDTRRFHVVCANILGGCMGTTGPSSIDPRTGRPYGSTFPSITTGDIVRVHCLLLRQLGIKRLVAVIGGSFGGMQVLEWSIRHPEMAAGYICIASAMSLSAQALAFDIVGRNAILDDPAWAGGDYYDKPERPVHGLAQARMIGHITYLSSENMKRKFGREKKAHTEPLPRFSTSFQVESYLDYQGDKFVSRFDANSYLHISEAMDVYDLAESAGDPEPFRRADTRARFLIVALSSDWLFPPEQSLEVARALVRAQRRVAYCLLKSPYGHDAFLVEIERLAEVTRAFLQASCDAPPALDQAEVGLSPQPARNKTLPWRSGDEFHLIEEMIHPGTRVLDLGCGDGELLCRLLAARAIHGLGMDIDLDNVIQAIRRGLDVFQCDLDAGLEAIPDQTYDYAILSQTLQVVRKPRYVLNEMLRVAREGIITFPNFGHWRHRLRLGLRGRMPISRSLPFAWYDTPNIHHSTLSDFRELCVKDNIAIMETVCVPGDALDAALLKLGLRNLGADHVLFRIARANRNANCRE